MSTNDCSILHSYLAAWCLCHRESALVASAWVALSLVIQRQFGAEIWQKCWQYVGGDR